MRAAERGIAPLVSQRVAHAEHRRSHRPPIEQAARVFLDRIAKDYPLTGARLFGSRARGEATPDSDADLAVFLKGSPGNLMDVSVEMAGVAFDVLVETDVLISPLPIWEEQWAHPEAYSNPGLLENIRRDSVSL